MPKNIITVAVTAILTTLPALAAVAQSTTQPAAASLAEAPATNGESGWRITLNSSYTAPSTAKFQGARLASSDAFNVSLGLGKNIPLNREWFLQFDLGQDNLFLDSVPGALIPDSIHMMRFGAGAGYHLNDRWTVTGMISPSLYRLDDVQGNDIGLAGGVLALYRANSKLTWSFGIMAAPDSDVPVLPVVGVRWLINDQYTLEVGAPKTRLSYRVNRRWTLYTGLDMVGTVFRTSADFGTKNGTPQYNNALATYRDIRLGVGVACHIVVGLNAELETGASVYREINYTDVDSQVKFDPGAYVRLGLNYRF